MQRRRSSPRSPAARRVPARYLERRGDRDPRRNDTRLVRRERGGTRQRDAHSGANARLGCRRAANPLLATLELPLDERGRVPVDATLRVEGLEDSGRSATAPRCRTSGRRGRFDPPTCQHALRQARRLAKNMNGDAAAVRLPDARSGGDARPLQGHRRGSRREGCVASPVGSSTRTYHLYRCRLRRASCVSSPTGRSSLFFRGTSSSSPHSGIRGTSGHDGRRSAPRPPAADGTARAAARRPG